MGAWLVDAFGQGYLGQAMVLSSRGTKPVAASAFGTRQAKVTSATLDLPIEGMLVPNDGDAPFLRSLTRITSYASIRAALAQAANDPNVQNVRLRVSSPGGSVAGLHQTILAIEAFPKPITALASYATSAAYGLVAATKRIAATGPDATFGSIGTVASFLVDGDLIEITNSQSPAKRPDVRTVDGKAIVREYLDQVFSLFVDGIARGRNLPRRAVLEDFGQGRLLLASAAKACGMIDAVGATTAPDLVDALVSGRDLGDMIADSMMGVAAL